MHTLPAQDEAGTPSSIRRPDTEPLPGYRLVELIGHGGRGEVWKCAAPGGVVKAIKLLPRRLAEPCLEALQRVKVIRHPALLFLDRIKLVDDKLVLVMELADRNLYDVLRQWQSAGSQGVPREVLLRHLREAAGVLDLLNQQLDLPHLNVKPENLLLIGDRLKVADAGLAAAWSAAEPSPYEPPELRSGLRSRGSDQYSLAVVCQEMLTGRLPGGEVLEGSGLSERARAVLARALHRNAQQRFPTCGEFIQALIGDTSAQSTAVARLTRTTLFEGNGRGIPSAGQDDRPVADTVQSSQPGTCEALPGYHFLSCVERQPGGEVWLVTLPDGRSRRARFVQGFGDLSPQRQAEVHQRLAGLTHPALLRQEAARSEAHRLILVTELPELLLRERLARCQAQRLPGIPRPELLACLSAAAEALDTLRQEHDLQHLGLNPSNLLLQRGGLLLMDFGLTQLCWLPAGLPVGQFNYRYAPPELLDGRLSPASDQYSLAVLYAELLTGQHPFRGQSRPRNGAERLRQRPDLGLLSAGDREAIARALHRDPRRRFDSCSELVRALEEATRRKKRDAEEAALRLPSIIAWPSTEVEAAEPAAPLPTLEQMLPQLLAQAAGPFQVQEYQSIRYLLHPGRLLQYRCAAWLPPGVAHLKLNSFARQWQALPIHCDEVRLVFHMFLTGSLWQRCLGKQLGLEVAIDLRQPAPPMVKMTEVSVQLKPLGGTREQAAQLLWQMGPRVLESLRGYLQACPEQRLQPRLMCEQPVRVSTVASGMRLATPVACHGKDISPTGIGFFLPDQPTGRQVYLNMGPDPAAASLGVLARIVRVQPCGDGWYEVGAAFPIAEAPKR